MNNTQGVNLLLEYLHEEMLPDQNVAEIGSLRIGVDQPPETFL